MFVSDLFHRLTCNDSYCVTCKYYVGLYCPFQLLEFEQSVGKQFEQILLSQEVKFYYDGSKKIDADFFFFICFVLK